jgi:hypothetical protein
MYVVILNAVKNLAKFHEMFRFAQHDKVSVKMICRVFLITLKNKLWKISLINA